MNEKIYQSAQAKSVIKYVREQYGDELEFLWQKFPTNSIWRNPRNRKWYGALLIVPRNKLGLDSEEPVEILDLRFARHEALDFVASQENVYPGYHMNKHNWITVILDDSLETERIFRLIDQSYEIAAKLK